MSVVFNVLYFVFFIIFGVFLPLILFISEDSSGKTDKIVFRFVCSFICAATMIYFIYL